MALSKSTFTLKSDNADFNNRQKNVFDQLKVLEQSSRSNSDSTNEEMDVDEKVNSNRRNQRSFTKHFRGKESIFKKPQNPVPKNYFRGIPDFKKNPHKWTRYSLEDVNEEDISDKSNTKAALSFLKELKDRKSSEMDCDDIKASEENPTRIIFKKRTPLNIKPKEVDLEESKISFRSSKVVMPEYVVGQKEKKERRNRIVRDKKEKELKLDHLLENDEGE